MILLGATPQASTFETEYDQLFAYTCEQVANIYDDVDCSDIDRPYLVVTKFVDLLGAVGIYLHDEPYIFISPFAGRDFRSVIIHEMTHYVLWESWAERDRCRSEEVARFVAGQSRPWRENYECYETDNTHESTGSS